MLEQYYIRKQKCNHYSIFKVIDIYDIKATKKNRLLINSLYGKYDFAILEVAHLETFSDVLVLLNCGVVDNE